MSKTLAADVPAQARRVGGAPRPDRFVDGLRVIEERPVLSTTLPIPEDADPADFTVPGFTEVTLEDGSVRVSCSDCEYYGSRKAVQNHRAQKHRTGASPRARNRTRQSRAAQAVAGIPADLRSMSLGDVLEMGARLEQLALVIENVTAQRDELHKRNAALEAELRKITLGLAKAGFHPEEEGRR
jgi:hypothetical protein